MSRQYKEDEMLKSKGITYFPPVKEFKEALSIYNECGGMIISLEEDGFMIDEPDTISKLYDIPKEHLEMYFKDALNNNLESDEINSIISKWKEEEINSSI
ncbi:MAG: hypothetical protein OCD02_08865 [Spirochaetaceae bacterium]